MFKFKGAIQSDGYQAYHQFESLDQKLMLGCWDHARRDFERTLDKNKELRKCYRNVEQEKLYTYSLFPKLSRYHLDGRYRIDNNLVENSVRLLAIG